MQALLEIFFDSIGRVTVGSFHIPYNKVKDWVWECYCMVGGLMSWLIVPTIAAWLTMPNFMEIIGDASGHFLFLTFLMRLLWGFDGLVYIFGIRHWGLFLGNPYFHTEILAPTLHKASVGYQDEAYEAIVSQFPHFRESSFQLTHPKYLF